VYRALYNSLLSRIDAEQIHHLALQFLRISGRSEFARWVLKQNYTPTASMPIEAFGLHFNHPLGLAAGFDKDASALPALQALGFSFIEAGTVTPKAQPGNPKPRMFRLLPDDALINRLGFPSSGADAVAANLHTAGQLTIPIGISLGKNKDTPLTEAHTDYCTVLDKLYPYGNFFVVNISSPNTPELRRLQTAEFLSDLLSAVQQRITSLAENPTPKPLLVKIAPDLNVDDLNTLLDLCQQHSISGIIATNTTTNRDGLTSPHKSETGGLSGAPLRQHSTEIIRQIHQHTHGTLPIIGVGGIFDGEHIWEKLAAGAILVQAYTGFIYRGPMFVRKAIEGLQSSGQKQSNQDTIKT